MVGRSKKLEKIKQPHLLALALLGLLAPGLAHATGGDLVPGSRYVSGRGAALGDAYLGLGDTIADGLFYNPAALAKHTGLTVEPLNLQLQGNRALGSMIDSNFYKFQSLSSYESTLLKHPYSAPGASFAVLPSFGWQGFGFGMLYQRRMLAMTDGTNVRYRTTYQLIPSAGFALKLASGVLRIGYVIQWVNQASGDKTVSGTASPVNWNQGIGEGKGFSHNLGMTVTLPYMYQPTFSVVARNLMGLSYSGKPLMSLATNPSGTPAKEDMSLDASAGFLTKLGGGYSFTTQFEYRDALNSSHTNSLERFAAGVELTLFDILNLRGGFGSRYPSAGIGLKTQHGEVNFSWFSEDIGTPATPARDIRYLTQFIFRAF